MTMNNLIIKYPLDLTGLRPENLVTNESHTAPRERARGFAPRYGAFFTKSMRIVHAATGKPLVKGVDYLALHLYEKATRATGQEICAAVQIINDDLDGEFLLTYQVVGGEFSANVSVIEELLAALALDNRPVKWGEILGLPNAFPPSAHLHDVDDLYGFEYLIEALDRIRSAILLGDYYDHEEIRQRIENLRNFLLEEDQKIIGMLDEHMRDHSNPHAVTKAQVGLGNVDNFPVASLAEAQAGTANNRYMTPERTHDLVKEKALKPLTAHINDKANPHATTKAQVGLGSVENFGVASQAEAEAGSSNSLYTTVLRVMQMITKFAVTPLGDHIADKSNPHGTTKAQVGLGNVDNYATATQAEAEAGAANNLFVTPFTVLKMIVKHAGELLAAHINNKANPHEVTKTQVGLGSVENFTVASLAEAQAGTANNRYMTPERSHDLVKEKALKPLSAHINDKANPHAVTKAQVELGNVDNFKTATQAEAEAGTATNLFVTPFTVLKMIAKHAVAPLTAHINDKANPHGVTKTQVGLGSVENFPVASLAEAQAGTANNRYMTPERAHDLVKEKALKPLTAHIEDKNNPHATTKTHVGLGNVDNFKTATQAEAEAGTATNLFVTPFTVLKMIAKYAQALLTAHIGDKANPHETTKAQVGLGSVDNFPTATTAEMQTGTATNRFATPAGVRAVLNGDLGNYVPKTDVNYSLGSAAGKIPFTSAGGVTQLGNTWRGGSVTVTMSGTTAVFNGNVDAVDCISRSDIRDKREPEKLSYARAVAILRESEGGHTYFLLDEDRRTGGVIAQYLLKNYPEALVETTNAAGEPRWGVRYNAISGLLMTLALGQENRLDSMEAELKALKELIGR